MLEDIVQACAQIIGHAGFTPIPWFPFSERGQANLDTIRSSLGLDPSTTYLEIRRFLEENHSLIRHLMVGTIPHPDWQFELGSDTYEVHFGSQEAWRRNSDLWQAIWSTDWDNDPIENVIQMGRDEGTWTFHHAMRRARRGMLPKSLLRRLLAEDDEFAQLDRERFSLIKSMRQNRPQSLLRTAVRPEDVVD